MALKSARSATLLLTMLAIATSLAAQGTIYQLQQTLVNSGTTTPILNAVTTAQDSAAIPNIGTTNFSVCYVTTGLVSNLEVLLIGSYLSAGPYFITSDVATNTTSGCVQSNIPTPFVKVRLRSISGTPAFSVTANSVGTSVLLPNQFGVLGSNGWDFQNVLIGAAAGTNSSTTITPPRGRTSGTVLFYNLSTCVGSTLSAQATEAGLGGLYLLMPTTTINTSGNLWWDFRDTAVNGITFTYLAGSGCTGTYSIFMSYNQPLNGQMAQGALPSGSVESYTSNGFPNPLKAGAKYNAVAPTFTTGSVTDLQSDVNGQLKVSASIPGTVTITGSVTIIAPLGNQTPAASVAVTANGQGSQTEANSTSIVPASNATTAMPTTLKPSASATFALAPVASTAYEASRIFKASAGNLYGFIVYNSNASAQFILCFNATSLPANGTATVTTPLRCAATSTCSYSAGTIPRAFSTGIVCGNSSTSPTLTTGAADVFFEGYIQ